MENFMSFLIPFYNFDLLLLVALGTIAGIFIGAIPGLSVTMAVALLLSLTYTWDVLPALALMVGVYIGGVFGGSRAAILMNMPGSPASIATSFDGYPMSQKGEAGIALSLTTIYSVIGGIIGIIVLAVAAPIVSQMALLFAQRDYFLIAILGLLLVGSLSKGALSKGVFIAGLGVIIGLVGMDPMTGAPRFTFGSLQLMTGVNFVVAVLGLFGLSEVLYQMRKLHEKGQVVNVRGLFIPTVAMFLKFLPLSIRTGVLGVLIGALPGAGGEIAALISYDHAKRSTKNPTRPFGEGAHEGVIAPESGNNAAIGGAMIPMLTLGIPGDAVTAIFIGVLFIHGLQPGPLLMTNTPDLFWVIVGSSLLANIFLLIFGLLVVSIFVKIVTIPKQILLPIVALITIVGAYAINYSITNVYWVIAFGIVGYLMKVNNFSVGPLVLGIILGLMIDVSFRRAFLEAGSSFPNFFLSYLSSPISLVLLIVFIYTVFSQTKMYENLKRKLVKS